MFFGLFVCSINKEISKKYGFPFQILNLAVAIILGSMRGYLGPFGKSIEAVSYISPFLIRYIMTPIIVFEACFRCD